MGPGAHAVLTSDPKKPAEPHGEAIRIRGARVHNLRDISLDLPRDRVIVITGPSGSGKSSLAFDTLYAEGQRQYIESLSVYARQFLNQLERPDVDLIEGLPPTICIDQRSGSQNPRSTVATVTEVYDYLRLLYARLGQASCWKCGEPIRPQTTEQILDRLLELPDGTRLMILAPLVRGRKGEHQEVLAGVRKAGFVRVRVDGVVYDVEQPPTLARQKAHQIEAVVDRLVLREGIRPRLAESIQLGLRHGDGLVAACVEHRRNGEATWTDTLFSTHHSCPNCRIDYEELEPRSFSFNSPYGACPECEGLGARLGFDPDLVIPDDALSLAQGAIAPWRGASASQQKKLREALQGFLKSAGVRWNMPLAKYPPKARRQLLEGNGKQFIGVQSLLEKQYATTLNDARRQALELFRSEMPCTACGGSRLRPEARSVRIAEKSIDQVTALTADEAARFFGALKFSRDERAIAVPLLSEICSRLQFLVKVGLGYLNLNRAAATLSGGELQRVRLAAGLGSGLVGACYVLDEPSIGLHPRDNQRLIDSLRDLQRRENTVIVVEHDEAIMRQADWIVDLGPGAGKHGGEVVAEGTPEQVAASADSLTGRYLSGQEVIPFGPRRPIARSRSIVVVGATANNLQNITVRFPLGVFVCITGVSGSGKSSLVDETLARALRLRLTGCGPRPGPVRHIRGANLIDKLVQIDQTPIGRTPRSNPATYTGVFDEIRKVFANTREAKQRGYRVGRFSFNVKGGRCEECQGQGQKRIEMNFLPDLFVTCPVCEGRRFNRQTLEVRYRDRTIAEVLDMSVDEALEFFDAFPALKRLLLSLQEVGLGYVALGQPSTTLSGGETQRIKLAAELSRVDTGKTLYILDEPTTGLHFDDVRRLLVVLHRLVDRGNSVVVIEHHLDVIKTADWIIDLGPEGGSGGGRITAEGTPEQIAAMTENYTGRCLREVLPVGDRARRVGGSPRCSERPSPGAETPKPDASR